MGDAVGESVTGTSSDPNRILLTPSARAVGSGGRPLPSRVEYLPDAWTEPLRVGVDVPEVEVEMLRFEGPLGDASRSEAKDERDEEEKNDESRFFPFVLLDLAQAYVRTFTRKWGSVVHAREGGFAKPRGRIPLSSHGACLADRSRRSGLWWPIPSRALWRRYLIRLLLLQRGLAEEGHGERGWMGRWSRIKRRQAQRGAVPRMYGKRRTTWWARKASRSFTAAVYAICVLGLVRRCELKRSGVDDGVARRCRGGGGWS
jgi:hypothetical protein